MNLEWRACVWPDRRDTRIKGKKWEFNHVLRWMVLLYANKKWFVILIIARLHRSIHPVFFALSTKQMSNWIQGSGGQQSAKHVSTQCPDFFRCLVFQTNLLWVDSSSRIFLVL